MSAIFLDRIATLSKAFRASGGLECELVDAMCSGMDDVEFIQRLSGALWDWDIAAGDVVVTYEQTETDAELSGGNRWMKSDECP